MSLPIYAFDAGQLRSEFTILSTTGATIVVSPQDNDQTAVSITVTNVTASPATLTLEAYSGTVSYKFLQAYPVPALGTLPSVYIYDTPIRLTRNWSIRATAGTSNALHVIANSVLAVGRTVI